MPQIQRLCVKAVSECLLRRHFKGFHIYCSKYDNGLGYIFTSFNDCRHLSLNFYCSKYIYLNEVYNISKALKYMKIN